MGGETLTIYGYRWDKFVFWCGVGAAFLFVVFFGIWMTIRDWLHERKQPSAEERNRRETEEFYRRWEAYIDRQELERVQRTILREERQARLTQV